MWGQNRRGRIDLTFLAEAPPDGAPEDVTVYRALREDVDFRYAVVAPGGGYEVVRDEGDVDGSGGVLFFNPFEVSPADDEKFLAAWDAAREVLEAQHGFLGRRMHRSTGDAELRFVNLGRWSSPLMFARAIARPEVAAAVARIDFPSHPALYLPVPQS
jgi:heme-degrading monooxygenase HmoA